MLNWALRCLATTLIVGATVVGLQSGGMIERVLAKSQPAAEPPARHRVIEESGSLQEEVVIQGDDGHFVADVEIGGTTVSFLIDTGASHTVLNQEDAERLQLTADQLSYDMPFESANGTTYAAPVTLGDVRLGQFQLDELEAFVNEGDLAISLLGMSFLGHFDSYEVEGDRLVLRW